MTASNLDDIIRLHPADNIGVCRRNLSAHDTIIIDGEKVSITEDIPVGHKVALIPIQTDTKILKYGAAIGSAIADIGLGCHVHLHNMKSDYIDSHTRDAVGH